MTPSDTPGVNREPRIKFVHGQKREVSILLRRESTGGWEAVVEYPPGEELGARVFR